MLVPAVINIAWISNYAGPHRVCYRVVGTIPYTCTIPGTPGPGFHPVCAGGGAPCGYAIDIMVDNETCDTIQYEGYVQAACEDILSVVGRIPFPTISFIPSPACKRWEVECTDSPVLDATINTGGTGYTPGSYPGLPTVGGGGLGATFDVTVNGGGIITVVALNAAGSGYTSAPVLDISSIPYTPGTPADISINLLGCTALTIYDCAGVTAEILPLGTFQPTETYDMCGSVEPTIPADYSVVELGNCLCNCIINDIGNSGPDGVVSYTYIACNGAVVTGTLATGVYLGDTCMAEGSLIVTGVTLLAVADIVVGAACDAV